MIERRRSPWQWIKDACATVAYWFLRAVDAVLDEL